MRVFPTVPLLNFLSMLLLTIQRGSADLFRLLTGRYASAIHAVGIWDDVLAHIGERYFGIQIPRHSNPLLDMMGSMLFGGGGSEGAGARGQASQKRVGGQPANVELD